MATLQPATELLINATRVGDNFLEHAYEFVINDQLLVTECVHIESLGNGLVLPILDFKKSLKGTLFELNHVRVNPLLDNTVMTSTLTQALRDIGVGINNPPPQDSMAQCFRPLGEIKDNVRFHLNADGSLQFLTSHVHLTVLHNPNYHQPASIHRIH